MYENINVVTIDCFIMYEEDLHWPACIWKSFFLIDHDVHVPSFNFIYDRLERWET